MFGGGDVFMGNQPKHFFAGFSVLPENQPDARISSEQSLRVKPEYVTVVNARRRFVEVSPSFCKLLGYTEDELLGRLYDDFTVPGTNHIPITWQLFLKTGYLFGIWVFAHKSGTKLFVRFEAFARADGQYETHMELLAAGA
jgi:PAS domain S-box-containing protein